jgi:hypothetical protein
MMIYPEWEKAPDCWSKPRGVRRPVVTGAVSPFRILTRIRRRWPGGAGDVSGVLAAVAYASRRKLRVSLPGTTFILPDERLLLG